MDSIFVEIISKVDVMLLCDKSNESSLSDATQIAKDYLKMLHNVITTGNMSDNGNKAFEVLQRHASVLVERLDQCITFGFEIKATSITEQHSKLSDKVDVGLVSVSLACLFAMFDCKDLLRNIMESKVTQMVSTGIKYLVDVLYFPTEGSSLAPKDEQDLSRGLNAFLLKIGSSKPIKNGVVICSIIDVLSLCIEEKNISNARPVACAKPLSRLLLKVLSNEASRGTTKAFHLPNVDAMRLMAVLHSFFNSHPSTVPSNDVPYCCAKTVLFQLIEALGAQEIDRLCNILKISETSFLYRLFKRLSSKSEVTESEQSRKPQELIPSIVEMIDSVTTARDKQAAIRHLHVLLKENPRLNVLQYLQHTSSTFRNFVVDTLSKLENDSTQTTTTLSFNDTNESSSIQTEVRKDGTEALKILEGLKANSMRSVLASPMSESSTHIDRNSGLSRTPSNRSQIQDKIKGTLNSISASLDNSNINSPNPIARQSSLSKKMASSFGADSDLAARLARLKRMEINNNAS